MWLGVGGAPVVSADGRPAKGTGARRLSPEDQRILALENETVAGHTCKVIELDGPLDVDRLRASIAERLPRAPKLGMRLTEIDGAPWWIPDSQVDIAAQVVESGRSATADEAGFLATVSAIFAQHLDRSRPLWRMDVIPRIPGGGCALVWRIHHAVVAGGLRRWLEAHHGHLGAVRVKVPVSLHTPPLTPGDADSQPGNRDSFFCLDLPLGSADPLARLTAIRGATRVRKQGHDAQHLDALMRGLAHTPRLSRFADRILAHPRSFALNVSNVPGPRAPIQVLGVPVRTLYTLAEIREYHALRVSVVSFADSLNFGLVADPTLLDDVDQLAAHMHAEAATLIASGQRED
jgi:hypothetical protein